MALLKRAPQQQCPLCDARLIFHFHQDKQREYLRCYRCLLVFVPVSQHLNEDEERSQYTLHNNQDTPDYRQFLQPALQAVEDRVASDQPVLDFGCGPGPVLAQMLREAGYDCQLYDPFFEPDNTVLQTGHYSAVTATEVVEHLRQPRKTLEQMWNLIKPGGWLILMTDRVQDQQHFTNWHYIRDLTHIAFYTEATFEWLARTWKAELQWINPRLLALRKPEST